ncbi:MAG TPA: hypothetical protein EYG69_01290 [Campylobacterales bacterium]|nr:hypothetical protein [Campylobacterales bacterium]
MIRVLLIALLLTFTVEAKEVTGMYAKNKQVKKFINHMIRKHNFKRSYLVETFSKARKPIRFKTKKRKRKIAQGVAKGKKGWLKYSGYTKFEKSFLAEDRVRQGVKFVKRYKTLLNRVEKKFKVDKYIIASIIGTETYYGEIKGEYEAFNTLVYNSFKKKRRAKYFKYELEHLLLLCYRQKLNIHLLKGSKYSALGIGQLMPHAYIRYGVSFDKNNKIEPFSYPDSIATVANYLHKKGWKYKKEIATRASYHGLRFNLLKTNSKKKYSSYDLYLCDIKPRKKPKAKKFKLKKLERAEYDELWLTFKNFDVIKKYNHSNYYAMAVHQLANEIRKRDK